MRSTCGGGGGCQRQETRHKSKQGPNDTRTGGRKKNKNKQQSRHEMASEG